MIVPALCVLAFPLASLGADADLAGFTWRCEVREGDPTARLNRVRLTEGVFAGSRAFPFDLRLLDGEGNERPFFIREADRTDRARLLSGGLFRVERRASPSNAAAVFSYQGSGTVPVHNRILLDVRGDDIECPVEVWAGDDTRDLRKVAEGVIVSRHSPVRIRHLHIDYDLTDAPVVEVRLVPGPGRSPPELLRADLYDQSGETRDGSMAWFEPEALPPVAPPPPGGPVDTYLYDLGSENLPVAAIRLFVEGKDHVQAVRLFGRNDESASWRWIGDGSIYRVKGLTGREVDVRGSGYRFLKVELPRTGDIPVKLDRVEAGLAPHDLYFEPDGKEDLYLYFGSDEQQLPLYDLMGRARDADIDSAPEASLGRKHKNPDHLATTLGSYRSALFRLLMLFTALLLGIVLVRLIRRRLME